MKFNYSIKKTYRYVMLMKTQPKARVIQENDIPDPPPETELKDAGPGSYYIVKERREVEIPFITIFWYRCRFGLNWRRQLIKELTKEENRSGQQT